MTDELSKVGRLRLETDKRRKVGRNYKAQEIQQTWGGRLKNKAK
jgi:hypothetical protein